jgi:27-O-demethylrifamycin SV methyltransferase
MAFDKERFFMTDARPDSASHYDRWTDAWRHMLGDDFHVGYFAHPDLPLEIATKRMTRLLAENAALQPGMNVLDVGCGTGSPALHLAQEHNCRVLGISTSEVCVERATALAARANMSHQVRFEVRDGVDTGLDAGSFDCVWAMESSHLMPRKDLLLTECSRVLRPGGRLVLCDFMLLRQMRFQEVPAVRKEILVLDKVFGKAVVWELPEYVRSAKEAGFRVLSELDITRETLPTFDRWRANSYTRASVFVELLGSEALEQFRAACDIFSRSWLDRLGYGVLVAERAS